MSTRQLRLAVSTGRLDRRGANADPWRTIAGWLWIAYVGGVVALATWFLG